MCELWVTSQTFLSACFCGFAGVKFGLADTNGIQFQLLECHKNVCKITCCFTPTLYQLISVI